MTKYTFTTGFAKVTVEADSFEKASEIAANLWPTLKINNTINQEK